MGPHGKRWTFVKYKCRCEACCAANDAYMRAYRQRNKAKILAKEAERYQRKKDAIIDRMGDYYQREKSAIQTRQKRPLTRARRSSSEQARRAHKLCRFVEEVSPPILYKLYNGQCGICRKPIAGDFHVDHIVPLSRGGMHSYANTQPAHPRCNERKHNRLPTIEELEAA